MSTLSELLTGYLEYNPKRIYFEGDYIIGYHSTYESICKYVCNQNETTGAFSRKRWNLVVCAKTGFQLDLGQRAPYLGDCASRVVYKTRLYPERLAPALPKWEDIFFDNPTFPI
jgi:hypothetical protein